MTNLTNRRILVIDDTASIRIFLRISLEAQGVKLYEAETAGKGLEYCQKFSPDLVVLDLGLPDRDGLEILPELKAMKNKDGQVPAVIILSVRKESSTKEKAYELGADDYVTKPFMMENLLEVIQEQLNGVHA